MKVRAMKKLIAEMNDNADVELVFNLVDFSYTGYSKELHRMTIKRGTKSAKKLTLYGERSYNAVKRR